MSDPPSEQNIKYDDNYYDLDDDFIDDGDLELNHDDMASDMYYGADSSLLPMNSSKPDEEEEGKD